ncbi:MAG: aspartate kinase [Acidobacteriota bacterium]|nr:aspartate kinase [Acidobacteriota bacterium]
MITIAQEVKRIVRESPFLEEGLSRGIINYSALAREIKRELETGLMKPVSTGAVLMALKRLAKKLEPTFPSQIQRKVLQEMGDLTVRANLIGLTYANSTTIFESQRQLLEELYDQGDRFLTFTHAISETTLLLSARLESIVERVFASEQLIKKMAGLSAVMIKFSAGAVSMPGIHYRIFRQLAWRNINVIEVVSTHQELILILDKANVDLAFSTLMGFMSH